MRSQHRARHRDAQQLQSTPARPDSLPAQRLSTCMRSLLEAARAALLPVAFHTLSLSNTGTEEKGAPEAAAQPSDAHNWQLQCKKINGFVYELRAAGAHARAPPRGGAQAPSPAECAVRFLISSQAQPRLDPGLEQVAPDGGAQCRVGCTGLGRGAGGGRLWGGLLRRCEAGGRRTSMGQRSRAGTLLPALGGTVDHLGAHPGRRVCRIRAPVRQSWCVQGAGGARQGVCWWQQQVHLLQ